MRMCSSLKYEMRMIHEQIRIRRINKGTIGGVVLSKTEDYKILIDNCCLAIANEEVSETLRVGYVLSGDGS